MDLNTIHRHHSQVVERDHLVQQDYVVANENIVGRDLSIVDRYQADVGQDRLVPLDLLFTVGFLWDRDSVL